MFELILLIVRAIVVACHGQTDRAREPRPAAAIADAAARRTPSSPHARSDVLGVARQCLADLAVGPRPRATRNRDPLASRVAPATMGAVLRPYPRRTPSAGSGTADIDRQDGGRESVVGCAAHPRGTPNARNSGVGTYGIATGASLSAALPHVAHVPHEPCLGARVDGCLHPCRR